MKIIPVLLALAAAGLAGCDEIIPLEEQVGSFEVTLDGTVERGTIDDPLPFPEAPFLARVSVQALSNKGGPIDLDGDVTLYVTPGQALETEGTREARITLTDGVGTGELRLQHVFGRTHICARDDRRPGVSTFAAGCSETMYYRMPTVRQMQLTEDGTTSPLVGSFVEIRRGDLIVTGILAEGFFLTDLAEQPSSAGLPGNFAGLFVFSFSYPEDLVVGDRIESVTGTVQEFTGASQLTFPSWVRKNVPRAMEDLPEPVEITTEMCAAATTGTTAGLCGHHDDDLALESLESDVVKVTNVRMPNLWMNCDFNRDGDIANYDPACTDASQSTHCAEIACKAECNANLLCSELSSFRTYGQWSVAMNGGDGPKINVLTREGYPDLNPLEGCSPVDPEASDGDLTCVSSRRIDIAGNLRHSLPARPRWVVVARFGDDVRVYDDP